MWIWIALLVFLIVSMLLGALYLTVAFARFGVFRRVAGESLWKRRALSFGFLLLLFALLTFTMNMLNAVIVFLHLIAAFFLFGLLDAAVVRFRGDGARSRRRPSIWRPAGTSVITSGVPTTRFRPTSRSNASGSRFSPTRISERRSTATA